ncbi:MAG: UrcA family protein [Janthinobacterium lividum]
MKILLLILLAVPATSAIASTRLPDAPRAIVRYDDLDLHTSAGAAALRSRIDRTVVRISGGDLATTDGPALAGIAKARAQGRSQADCLIAAVVDNGDMTS